MYIKKVMPLGLMAILGCFIAQAGVFEYHTVTMLNKHVTCPDTLVVFDIDNTVLDIPTDRWFASMFGHAKSLGHDDVAAINLILPHYFEQLKQVVVSPAESDTVAVIHALQDAGIATMALTTRSAPIADCTKQQLASIGVDFSKTAITPYDITFALKEPMAVLRGGVMYCGNNDKGQALKAVFNATGYKPKKIVFIDDKEKYVKSVMSAAGDLGIDCVGIRYSHLDQKLHEFVLDHESKALIKPVAQELIVEHDAIESVNQYLVPNSMVLFDLDETVMRIERLPEQLGSSRWLAKLIQYAIEEHGFTAQEIDDVILPYYYQLQHNEPMVPVEDATVQVINQLQKQGIPVMALTARRLEIMEPTLRNLRAMGIDFSATAPLQETTSFAINHPNIFINGVMFCGGVICDAAGKQIGHAKDLGIKALLKHLPTRPDRIVVVDDRPNYLLPIVDAIASLGIDCIGIRYSACDHHVKGIILDEQSKAMITAYAAQKIQK